MSSSSTHLASECCHKELNTSKIDGLCANVCYEAPSKGSELEKLAGFAKCPSNVDCGTDRLVKLDHGDEIEIVIKGVKAGGLCVYNFYSNMMSTVNPKIKEFQSEFKFKLIESTPDAFIAGFVSNNEHEEPISGIVEFKEQFDSDNQKHFYTIDQ